MATASKFHILNEIERRERANADKAEGSRRDADLVNEIRDAVNALCAKMNEARARGITVNFQLGQSAPDTEHSVTRLEISKKL
jgi:hypothetical protein